MKTIMFQNNYHFKMTDDYFHSTKNGELFELKSDLNSGKKEKQKRALKKV